MSQTCVHKGCGVKFDVVDESECVYHPGPPIFHEGQKGWKCCKPRVLTFDEFMTIPPCTTGQHTTVDDTPLEAPKPAPEIADMTVAPSGASAVSAPPPRRPVNPAQTPTASATPPAPPVEESDDPSLPIPDSATCKRRGCGATYTGERSHSETCVHHPGQALFHEGSKGWTCCKRRVLEFDQFLKIEGCSTKTRHCFVGRKKEGVEKLDDVRNDFYQTPGTVIASWFLKKIDRENSSVKFEAKNLFLDLKTSDSKSFKKTIPLWAEIEPENSTFRVLGTKLEVTLAKADGSGWPVLRSDERTTGEIIQTGRAGRM